MPNVYIVGGGFEYAAMFRRHGWDVVANVKDADLVQFTGGEDVTPELYGHTRHQTTGNNIERDAREQAVFKVCLKMGKPMAGICRGGQFLNVMCGGKMFQNVNNHATIRGHQAKDERTGELFQVTSTHHQMMIPHKSDAVVIMTARESTICEKHIGGKEVTVASRVMQDIEALWYEDYKCFCFQPHPEFQGEDELSDLYFGYLDEFFKIRSARDAARAFATALNDDIPF